MCGRSPEWATLIRYAARREVKRCLPHKITNLYKNYESINVTESSKELRLRKRFRKLEPAVCKYEGWNFNSGNYLFTTDTK